MSDDFAVDKIVEEVELTWRSVPPGPQLRRTHVPLGGRDMYDAEKTVEPMSDRAKRAAKLLTELGFERIEWKPWPSKLKTRLHVFNARVDDERFAFVILGDDPDGLIYGGKVAYKNMFGDHGISRRPLDNFDKFRSSIEELLTKEKQIVPNVEGMRQLETFFQQNGFETKMRERPHGALEVLARTEPKNGSAILFRVEELRLGKDDPYVLFYQLMEVEGENSDILLNKVIKHLGGRIIADVDSFWAALQKGDP